MVQTKIGQYITEQINKDYGTDINVEQVALTVFGGVKLKKVLIKDHHKDTLFYINRLKTNILDFNKLYNGDLLFGDIRIDGLIFDLKQYKNEKETNLDKFVSAFDDGSPSTGKFLMKANAIYLKNSHFTMIDENSEDPKILEFLKINAQLDGFKIKGTDVTTAITKMSFMDFRGLKVENLKTQFTYTKKNILLQKLKLLTKNSLLNADVALRYEREDFSDFNNKVVFDIKVDTASVATNDIG
ncbi:MAG TPA: translocation/assembly module TamB, partial [Flavobacterium sp.]|nr:translocation/assembly module TamB [Flavobacterium sp.]